MQNDIIMINDVQGRSRSPILIPIESLYVTSYLRIIQTIVLSRTISKLWLIIGQIFVSDWGASL